MTTFALIPLMAFLNRFRGGGFYAVYLPGHPRFYVAPVVGLLVWLLMGDVARGICAGIVYLVWSFLPWGFLASMGRWTPQGRTISWLEGRCLDLARENYLVALSLLHLVGLLPAFLSLSLFAPLMAPLIAGSYWLGWRYRPKAPIELAELITGALWGALFVWG